MGWLIDLAEAAIPEPVPAAGAKRETSNPGALWWRVSILEPGGWTLEVDNPSGWTMTDWSAYADRYHGPGCAVTLLVPLPKPRAPVHLDEALRTACEGGTGITVQVFRALLCSEDIKDIEAGGIHPKTLHGYAQSFAEGMRSGRLVPAATAAKP